MVNAKKVSMISLGCCKNKVDAEVMLAALAKAGYEIVYDMAEADVIIVNTCGFIHDAKVESVNAILEAAEYKKRRCKALIVTGCLSGRYAEDLWGEIPEADAILGVTQYPQIVSFVERVLNGERVKDASLDCTVAGCSQRILTTPPWQGYLKIAEGCDNRCAFCVIPSIRGPYRSRPMEELLEEASWMAQKGVQELVVVAQDTTRYGKDLYGKPYLPQLLRALCSVKGLKWIRVLYCYPELVSQELLDTIQQEEKLCNYLDIPIQHVDDGVLRDMRRRSREAEIMAMMERIRALPQDMTLRTTMIVGFPGETEEAFQKLKAFIQTHPFDNLGAFTYSAEEGTPAAEYPDQVPQEVMDRRMDELMQVQQQVSGQRLERWVGQTVKVLIEEARGRHYVGRTAFQAPDIDGETHLTGPRGIMPGTFVDATITGHDAYDLTGEIQA